MCIDFGSVVCLLDFFSFCCELRCDQLGVKRLMSSPTESEIRTTQESSYPALACADHVSFKVLLDRSSSIT